MSRPFKNGKQTSIRRLSFYKLENDFVRQHGELSNDEGKTFTTKYDLYDFNFKFSFRKRIILCPPYDPLKGTILKIRLLEYK